jgi:hypothetical protein
LLKEHLPDKIAQEIVAIKFKDKKTMMTQLKRIFSTKDSILFHASYDLLADPLMSDSDHVSAATHEIWQLTGYSFR